MGLTPPLPNWVSHRDGHLEAFEPDRICRELFAALSDLGRPDPFLARELTDGVVHFLAGEFPGPPTTTELAEFVAKIVRELGQVAVAERFSERVAEKPPEPDADALSAPSEPTESEQLAAWVAERLPPAELARRAAGPGLRSYSLAHVYPPELVAAHRDGLLSLSGLDSPLELAGGIASPVSAPALGLGIIESVLEIRDRAGQFVALDSPEFALAPLPGEVEHLATQFTRELRTALTGTGLSTVVNLNCAAAPAWADEGPGGPLFADVRQPPDPSRLGPLTEALLDQLSSVPSASPFSQRIDWHLGERDFAPDALPRLTRVVRKALAGAALYFCFDRPKQAIHLAEGLDRRHSAALAVVGLHLPRLARQLGGPAAEPDEFLRKLGILARLAKSVGHAKQDFLRKQGRPSVASLFLLERSRLVVVPIGLEEVARQFTGRSLCPTGAGLEFARRVVLSLRKALEEDRPRYLDTVVDSCPPRTDWPFHDDEPPDPTTIAGLTAWEPTASLKQQIRSAAALHQAAGSGTASLVLSAEKPTTVDEIVGGLEYAWRATDLVRLKLAQLPSQRQLQAEWPSD